ncbi:cytochrome c oxidase assembly factor Coa1 family protein [Thermostichus vulcanus]|uniref:Uncharacterized protein n=1 Tax=Thermostichus vulcanus str. 'Rupite' TaxID=2813851 RepID=A0ABT0CD91_THEVL|nr:hypothetical protein [Thermostichus vulcanus str. 'Rupite']
MSESPQKAGCAAPLRCCGCGCLGALAVLSLGLAGVGFLFWNGIRASGAFRSYQLAVEALKQDAAVVERLGEPLRPGWLSQLRFQESEEAGWVCLSFLITGSQRTGEVAVESERGMAGKDSVPRARTEWQLRDLQVRVDGDPNPIQVVGPDGRESRCEGEESEPEALPLPPETEV